ncbi:transcription and mRNA export factor ENY2-like [Grammomys surdaster]|uniref:transcription and mRNA export factor ENY2-like n=1 Tax=Grammomys surdaster TaxID=491861 RepID=UPI0010A0960A|nr:transcription and mRNA export factor ENY2-like [Grammomys surdaster]
MNKDAQMRATIHQKVIETGERERLKELLRARLIECGWTDQLKAHCKEVIKEKGLEHVTIDDLVAEITPKGRALVPDSVKKEFLQRTRTFLAQHTPLVFKGELECVGLWIYF